MRKFLQIAAVVCLAVVPTVARACPFCSAVSLTFAQEIAQSEAAVIARLVEPPPASALLPTAEGPLPKGKFAVVEVLKGGELVDASGHMGADATLIETILLEEKPVGSLYLLMAVEPPKLVWSSPVPVSERAVVYIRKLADLPEKGPDRLAFFQQYLEDQDEPLARDAYDEFAVAPYEDVKGLEDRMDPTQLLAWITDPKVQTNRRRLYATMLGVCGTKADAKEIERILVGKDLDESEAEVRSGLDALIACHVTLTGAEGLDLVDELFLKRGDRDVPFTETYAAVMALRFLGEESETVPRERVLASLRLLLAEPKLADLVVADLARWQDWSVVGRLTELFETATADNIFVREPIVNYMRACPLPEAAEALVKLEKIDPDAVRRAATMAGLAGAIAAATPASQPADVDPGDPGGPGTPPDSLMPATAADLELAKRVAPVLVDNEVGEPVPAAPPAAGPSEKTTSDRGGSAVRWLIWVVVVVLVGMMARRMLRSNSAAS
ncbi:MAG: hypothetical protein O3A37_09700 [Planctomycetota bacterium]|nr:hypothetical protein [Planctomycetota bacterium]